MRDYEKETAQRVGYIKSLLKESGASGIVFGNSGGKDSALVGILCRMACENTLGVIMPCFSKRNYGMDMEDGLEVAEKFGIATKTVDLTAMRQAVVEGINGTVALTDMALANIAPRLRMTTLYAIAAAENRLVAGTGNRSELYVGYFTKWGDGAFDFNPIADLTVRETYEFLAYLDAPEAVRTKAPSGALFDGQTDEGEMGLTYNAIDNYLLGGPVTQEEREKIERRHAASEHKRIPARRYPD